MAGCESTEVGTSFTYTYDGASYRGFTCPGEHSDMLTSPHRLYVPLLSEGGDEVGLTKHGTGDVLREEEDGTKTASTSPDWTEKDQAALQQENEEADK